MPAKRQGSAPRAVDWPVRSPATFTRCVLSLSKTPKGAILPQKHSESGECRLKRSLQNEACTPSPARLPNLTTPTARCSKKKSAVQRLIY